MGAALLVERRNSDGQVAVHAIRQIAEQNLIGALGGDRAFYGAPLRFDEHRQQDTTGHEQHQHVWDLRKHMPGEEIDGDGTDQSRINTGNMIEQD